MKPVVLGIDTSGASCSVALVRGSSHVPDIYARRAVVGNTHSQHVLAMVRDVLADASVLLEQCDAIAYAAGPGSFTGLRVACAVAQGLAFGAGRPLVSVGTLDAIAHSAIASLGESSGEVLVAIDARMGEVYWSLMKWSADRLTAATLPALAAPATLGQRIAERSDDGGNDESDDCGDDLRGRTIAFGCGNAWSVHGVAMNGLVERVIHRDSADAVDVAQLGRWKYQNGEAVAPECAAPLYVRDDVALTTAERDAKRQYPAAARVVSALEHGA